MPFDFIFFKALISQMLFHAKYSNMYTKKAQREQEPSPYSIVQQSQSDSPIIQ